MGCLSRDEELEKIVALLKRLDEFQNPEMPEVPEGKPITYHPVQTREVPAAKVQALREIADEAMRFVETEAREVANLVSERVQLTYDEYDDAVEQLCAALQKRREEL